MRDEEHSFYERAGSTDIGAVLEKARNERGLSLEEAEHATKIRKRYLQGLERDDYSVLPGGVYTQGFLKTYANYLGLDGEGLVRELKSHRPPRREAHTNNGNFRKSSFDEPLISPGGLAGAERSSPSAATVITLMASIVVITGVIGALYYVGSISSGAGDRPASGESEARRDDPGAGEAAPPSDPGAEPGAESGASEEPEAENAVSGETEPPPSKVRVAVSVEGAPSWLSIRADGTVEYEQTAQPGFSGVFEAEREVSISTGNAGAVWVEVNGEDVGVLGGPGEVVQDLSFTPGSAT